MDTELAPTVLSIATTGSFVEASPRLHISQQRSAQPSSVMTLALDVFGSCTVNSSALLRAAISDPFIFARITAATGRGTSVIAEMILASWVFDVHGTRERGPRSGALHCNDGSKDPSGTTITSQLTVRNT